MKQAENDMRNFVKIRREYLLAAFFLHTKFYWACDVILWLQNSIDQGFHRISVNHLSSVVASREFFSSIVHLCAIVFQSFD